MSNYLIEFVIIHAILMLGYWLVLRKERQYAIMRYYLLASVVLSLVTPLFKLPQLFNSSATVNVLATEIIPGDPVITATSNTTTSLLFDLLLYLHIAGSLFFLARFIYSILYLLRLRYKFRPGMIEGSFSFFNWIFVSAEIDRNQSSYQIMLEHEKAHVALGHTYDTILLQLFKACFWWWPGAWLANHEMRKIHEYQADAFVLKSYSAEEYSSTLIRSTLQASGLTLSSSFHGGLIIERLEAIKQPKKRIPAWKFVMIPALCALTFVVFACTERRFDIQFVIEKDGSVSNITTANTADLDEARKIMRAAPPFQPRTQQGKAVRVRMTMPVVVREDGSIAREEMRTDNNQMKVAANYTGGRWYGTVYDEQGAGLPGVNITVNGSAVATSSDLDGHFNVETKDGDDIQLSFTGYETIKLTRK